MPMATAGSSGSATCVGRVLLGVEVGGQFGGVHVVEDFDRGVLLHGGGHDGADAGLDGQLVQRRLRQLRQQVVRLRLRRHRGAGVVAVEERGGHHLLRHQPQHPVLHGVPVDEVVGAHRLRLPQPPDPAHELGQGEQARGQLVDDEVGEGDEVQPGLHLLGVGEQHVDARGALGNPRLPLFGGQLVGEHGGPDAVGAQDAQQPRLDVALGRLLHADDGLAVGLLLLHTELDQPLLLGQQLVHLAGGVEVHVVGVVLFPLLAQADEAAPVAGRQGQRLGAGGDGPVVVRGGVAVVGADRLTQEPRLMLLLRPLGVGRHPEDGPAAETGVGLVQGLGQPHAQQLAGNLHVHGAEALEAADDGVVERLVQPLILRLLRRAHVERHDLLLIGRQLVAQVLDLEEDRGLEQQLVDAGADARLLLDALGDHFLAPGEVAGAVVLVVLDQGVLQATVGRSPLGGVAEAELGPHCRHEAVEQVEQVRALAAEEGAGEVDRVLGRHRQLVEGAADVGVAALALVHLVADEGLEAALGLFGDVVGQGPTVQAGLLVERLAAADVLRRAVGPRGLADDGPALEGLVAGLEGHEVAALGAAGAAGLALADDVAVLVLDVGDVVAAHAGAVAAWPPVPRPAWPARSP